METSKPLWTWVRNGGVILPVYITLFNTFPYSLRITRKVWVRLWMLGIWTLGDDMGSTCATSGLGFRVTYRLTH